MTRKLTDTNIKELRYANRSGYVIGFFSIIVSSAIYGFAFISIDINSYMLYILLGVLTGFLIMWIINRKFWEDLKNRRKDILIKKVQNKNSNVSYEAGSSIGYSFKENKSAHFRGQKEHDIYNLIIDNYRYKVKKELYDLVEIGDEVEFHYASKSKFLLSINKKN